MAILLNVGGVILWAKKLRLFWLKLVVHNIIKTLFDNESASYQLDTEKVLQGLVTNLSLSICPSPVKVGALVLF
ncbi:unnamed protein product [Absidia cylindrospora]